MPGLSPLLDELAHRLGLGALSLDAANPLSLCFDGKYVVTLNHDPDDRTLILSGAAGPAEAGPETLRNLLQESCLGARTGGAAFGLSPETGELLLWKRLGDEFPDYSAFEAELNNFLAQLAHWRSRLAEVAPAASLRAPAAAFRVPDAQPPPGAVWG
ncbi:MAG: type III secretion system chaperone [Planctomycetota bacterium]|jgi:hypothetical protein|nr:type III secretion system chaperone [Planctomycetota bacterium]